MRRFLLLNSFKQRLQITCIAAVTTIALTACDTNSTSPSSDADASLSTSSTNMNISQEVGESQLTQVAADNETAQNTIKITNTSSVAAKNMTVSKTGLKGITFSGCSGDLAADASCELTAKMSQQTKAETSGSVTISADNLTKDIAITAQSGSPFLLSSGNTANKPTTDGSPLLIKISNDSQFNAMFVKSALKVINDDSDKIAIDTSYKQSGSCFASDHIQTMFGKEVVVLKPGAICNLPIKVPNGAYGHAQVKIPVGQGNFFQPQFIPVNVSPALVEFDGNSPEFPDSVEYKLQKTSVDATFKRRKNKDKSEFDVPKLTVTRNGSSSLVNNFSKESSEILKIGKHIGKAGDYMMSLSGNNVAKANQPVVIHAFSGQNLSKTGVKITPVPKQNLEADQQTPGAIEVKIRPFGSFKSSPSIASFDGLRFNTTSPLGGQSKSSCNTSLKNGNTCTLWIMPNNPQGNVTNTTETLSVGYIAEGSEQAVFKNVKFDVSHQLVAGGNIQIDTTSVAKQHKKITNANLQPDVDSSSIMSWDGSQWSWQQAGTISGSTFKDIRHLVVNFRDQVCADGVVVNAGKKDDNKLDAFACFNGYRWLVNNSGLPASDRAKFNSLQAVPFPRSPGFSTTNVLIGGLLALRDKQGGASKIYYLPRDAVNASGDAQTKWQSFTVPDNLKLADLIVDGVDQNDNDNVILYAVTANKEQAEVYQLKVNIKNNGQIVKNKATQWGDPITDIKPAFSNQYQLAIDSGGNVYIGGQEEDKPVVFLGLKNNGSVTWSSGGGPDIKSTMISLETINGDNDLVMTVMNKNGKQGGLYKLNLQQGSWSKQGDTAYPALTVYDDDNGTQYLGTAKLDLEKDSLLGDTSILDGQGPIVSRSNASPSNKWSAVGPKTKGGSVSALVMQPHITINKITTT